MTNKNKGSTFDSWLEEEGLGDIDRLLTKLSDKIIKEIKRDIENKEDSLYIPKDMQDLLNEQKNKPYVTDKKGY